MIKHLVSYGFALFYTICLFTSPTNLIYVFVIPMVFVVTIYSDIRYLLLINIGTILESIIVVVLGATKGGFGYHGIEAAIIQIVVMIMVCANSFFTLKVIRENTRRRFTEVAHAKAQAENLLESNVELGKQLSSNIADINVRFEKLTAASKTTTEAMQEVSAGATDTAEHVQNQLEQTQAIQEKVDEVAAAVEEIGSSMALTLKALEEGKQDIEHLASEVEVSVDNGNAVTEKLENLNQYMDEMNSIVELIGGITNQTSLLALNASIEAARAGEAGRGFSVVATEISGMATRTKEATVHITELISNVSNAIMEVVGVVSKMVEGINDEKTGTSNAEESFESIEDNTRAIQNNADTLSRSISELPERKQGNCRFYSDHLGNFPTGIGTRRRDDAGRGRKCQCYGRCKCDYAEAGHTGFMFINVINKKKGRSIKQDRPFFFFAHAIHGRTVRASVNTPLHEHPG